MYLVDTNIFVEIFLKQERKEEAKEFLDRAAPNSLSLTEFSLYSIGIILLRRKCIGDYIRFLDDMIFDGSIHLIRLHSDEMKMLASISQRFHLDFDDAYQYTVAEKHNLHIVSFDTDFDRTERKRLTPQQVLQTLK
ncbi:MAG: PIN domain-containing protein [Bacteroidota bacterium]